MVYDDLECIFECLHHPLCVSVNLGAEEKLCCKLLSYDKENNTKKYYQKKSSHHYYFEKLPCSSRRCQNRGTCLQTRRNYKLFERLCVNGLSGEYYEKDIDECVTEKDECSNDAVCNNTKGSYNCTCRTGYSGDGRTCKENSICKEAHYIKLIRLLRLMETLTQLLNRRRRRRRFHPYWTFPRPVESWFEIHMHQRNFPEAFFRRHLRMGRDSFDNLLTLLRGYVQRENTRFRDCIPPEKVLAIGLYRIAHGGSHDNTALAMNVGKTTVHEAFRDVVNALYDIRNDFIKLPVTVDETAASIGTFEHLSMLPNIAGAIDGSHIKIRAPRESAVDYFSRYQQHDVVVQAVVNGRKLFIDVAAGFPGSLHDARVLRNSSIYQKAENGDILTAGPMYLIGADEIQPYLVGDSAYPLSPWLQKPYPEGTRDPGEIRFNKELSSARVVVECAFGILKSRWRILDAIEERNIAAVSKIIVACAVLHNFCILAGDEWDEDDFNDDDDNGSNNNDDVLRDGDDIRELLKNNL
ncbi:putative nuclease HARBI1 [Stylophora pistillata]|uniref:Putative nuclease HARBI1 n=1 Tax=Stylophora pistillata TaxID=50429 RepID=A0A2B4S158_STYPI|nr:putative nuclease HARBI1 [Stylophora pistillata]